MSHCRKKFLLKYTFFCFLPSFTEEHKEIGKRGYTRVVHINDPNSPVNRQYRGNDVRTTKYTAVNFIPKSLFEQFRRVANIYFLIVACVSFSPLAPYTASSVLFPLLVVIGATMAKEGVEDWRRRRQDIEANNRKVLVYTNNNKFEETIWKRLRVGDLVKVKKDEYFPADILLLSSSYEDGICYVETANLDGETNLKVKHALDGIAFKEGESSLQNFKAEIRCEDPNEDLYSFVGTLHYNNQQRVPLSVNQMLLRGSKLQNTEYIYGAVVFTGHDTKVMQNARDPPSKRSAIEKRMDKIIYVLFGTLIMISSIGSIFFGLETKNDLSNGRYKRWYLRPDKATVFYDPKRASIAAFFHFLTALMLYGYLIPISLYVSIEVVKVLQSIFINQDQDMYYKETNKPARARTSNLNEELGQVETILSDKTGTLTCNSMEFVKCSIAGVAYGRAVTEVERAMSKRKGNGQPEHSSTSNLDSGESIKGFNFQDERIMNGQWVKEPHSEVIDKFFHVLAICHTVIPDVNTPGHISYEAESPDEAAFVVAAREFGLEFVGRTQTSILLRERHREGAEKTERLYKLLHLLEFTPARKRMSVIVRNPEDKLLLLCKGADSVLFPRLSEDGRKFEDKTKEHIKQYAEAGLRTLVIAYRELVEEEFKSWEEELLKAQDSETDRDALVDAAADKIERDLILLGATAIEDKLQKGVPECIDKLADAGIKIWVLTGDKMETAINIGYACSLLRPGMELIKITLDSLHASSMETQEQKDKEASTSVTAQVTKGLDQIKSGSSESFGLIIDGNALPFTLRDDLKKSFLELALKCASVICCRSTPKQKALVTALVKGTGRRTLAIGDGANDVSMLQEADVGVGISGVEGMQAVGASDYAIAQFCYLERLLLVHGHWCYRRISMMICYFFYKNLAFGFTLFWFEAFASFSGRAAYNDWYMSLYNVFFTSLPVIALGVFDQDISDQLCLKHPEVYKEGSQNMLFKWYRILGWMLNGILSAMIIFSFTTSSVLHQAFRHDGHPVDYEVLGVIMYSCVVWTVNCQMALSINYFTLIQHVFIWGSIAVWYLFLVVYGSLPSIISTTAYKVFVEACAPSPFYWVVTLLVVVSSLLPYLTYRIFQTTFRPMPHVRVQIEERTRRKSKKPGQDPSMARTLLSSLFILLLAVVLVQGRFLSDDVGELVSDGVHDHYHAHAANNQSVEQSFLVLGEPRLSSSSTCDHAYGFFPCAENIPGYLFQIVIFQYLMSVAEQLVSSSSKKIFDTLGTGIFGATVFRILMVFPRIIMTISSGIFNSQEGAQNQVFFGIRVNAGATIFNLTILWGLCVIVGLRDRATQEKDSESQPSTKSFASNWLKNLKECGISTDASTCLTAGLMLLSLVPFVFVELVNVVTSASGQRIVVLVALIITVAFLLAYFAYQIIDPTIQKRSLHYTRFESLLTQNGKPNVSRIRLFFHLYDSDNNEQMSSRELEKFLGLIVTDEVQRMDAVRTMMKDMDADGNNRITEQEFLNGIRNLLANNSSPENAVAATPTSTPENDQEKSGEGPAAGEVDLAGKKIVTWDFIVTVLQVILGVVMLTFFAQPLMTNVIQFSGAVGVPTFIISFVVLPIVINGRMAIAAIFPASQKSSRAASLTFSEIYNGVTMSNLTGLLSLLAVVYARELTWDYSAEVLVVFVISLTIGFLAYFKTTYQLWTSIFAFFLYPFSLALFYVLQLLGWD